MSAASVAKAVSDFTAAHPKRLQTSAIWEGRTISYWIVPTPAGGWASADGISAAICGLGAGPDAWRRSIRFPCDSCGTLTRADLLQENCGSCENCADDFWCSRCGGHPDDCDGSTC